MVEKQKEILNTYKSIEKKIKSKPNNIFDIKKFIGSTHPQKYADYIKEMVKADLGFLSFSGEEDQLFRNHWISTYPTIFRFNGTFAFNK